MPSLAQKASPETPLPLLPPPTRGRPSSSSLCPNRAHLETPALALLVLTGPFPKPIRQYQTPAPLARVAPTAATVTTALPGLSPQTTHGELLYVFPHFSGLEPLSFGRHTDTGEVEDQTVSSSLFPRA